MADEILFLTELVGLRVFDLRGRRIGVVKDAALVPLVNPVRVDRFLIGGDAVSVTGLQANLNATNLSGALTVTTAAAEKVYRALESGAEVGVKLKVGDGGRLAWLPQETIVFEGARLK